MAGATQSAAPLNPDALRVMSFNIRVNVSDDGPNAWSHRRHMVASMIRFHQADVVGVQEAYREMTDDLQQRLPGYRWVGVGSSDGRDAGAANPIFWRESRLDLLHWETRWLAASPEVAGSIGWDARFPRTATIAVLRDKRSNLELHVFNTHFDHVGTRARIESGRMLAAMANDLPTTACTAAMGDFNCGPDDEAITEILKSQLRNARESSLHGAHGPSGSFTGFESLVPKAPPIDHIFVSPSVTVQQYGVLADHFDGRLPSDHFPVLTELILS